MKILLLLATTTDFGPKHANANPFYGQIQFNDGIEVDGDQIGAFAWTAAKYNESIGKEPIGNLLKKYTNTEIASVISDFVAAFKECHGQSRGIVSPIRKKWNRVLQMCRKRVDASLDSLPR